MDSLRLRRSRHKAKAARSRARSLRWERRTGVVVAPDVSTNSHDNGVISTPSCDCPDAKFVVRVVLDTRANPQRYDTNIDKHDTDISASIRFDFIPMIAGTRDRSMF